MATPKEIIGAALENGVVVPQQYIDDAYGMEGLTEQQIQKKFLDKYGKSPFFGEAKNIGPLTLPTIDIITGVLMIPGKTAEEKREYFIREFPKHVNEWKEVIEDNDIFGKAGWKTVKKVWQDASIGKMNQDIDKGRASALLGNNEDQNLAEYVGGHAMKFFMPRQFEAYARGEDPTWKDYVGDAVESGLYLVPGGVYGGGIAKGASVLPKVGPKVSQILGSSVGKNVVGNTMAPLLSETMDSVMRDENDPNVDRQDFSAGDVAMGAATNMGVNFTLRNLLQPAMRIAQGKLSRGNMSNIIGQIEGLGKSTTERGKEALKRAENVAKGGYVKEGDVQPSTVLGEPNESNIGSKASYNAARDFRALGQNLDNLYSPTVSDLLKVQVGNSKGMAPEKLAELVTKDLTGVEKKKMIGLVTKVLDGPYAGDAMNLIKGNRGMTGRERVQDFMNMGLPSLFVNRFGTDRDADLALRMLNTGIAVGSENVADKVKEIRNQEHTDMKNRRGRAEVSKILEAENLTDDDRKWLGAIRDNPEILKVGIKGDDRGNEDFKLWLIDRGNRLLMNSSIFRPTPDVM